MPSRGRRADPVSGADLTFSSCNIRPRRALRRGPAPGLAAAPDFRFALERLGSALPHHHPALDLDATRTRRERSTGAARAQDGTTPARVPHTSGHAHLSGQLVVLATGRGGSRGELMSVVANRSDQIAVTVTPAQARHIAIAIRLDLAARWEGAWLHPLAQPDEVSTARSLLDECADELQMLQWGEPPGDVDLRSDRRRLGRARPGSPRRRRGARRHPRRREHRASRCVPTGRGHDRDGARNPPGTR